MAWIASRCIALSRVAFRFSVMLPSAYALGSNQVPSTEQYTRKTDRYTVRYTVIQADTQSDRHPDARSVNQSISQSVSQINKQIHRQRDRQTDMQLKLHKKECLTEVGKLNLDWMCAYSSFLGITSGTSTYFSTRPAFVD